MDQIVGEFHFAEIHFEEWGNLDIIRSLTSKFVNVNYHMTNFACIPINRYRRLKSKAVEFCLVNKNLITLRSESRSYKSHPLNRPNTNQPDCQIEP